MMKSTFIVNNLSELENLGKIIAKNLDKGDLILFYGEIGSGKTTLIRYIAKELGVDERLVSSPSFVLINEYKGKDLKIFHIDVYKLGENTSVEDIGLNDYYYDDGIMLIEWADYLCDIDNNRALLINFKIIDDNSREIQLISHSEKWKNLFNEFS